LVGLQVALRYIFPRGCQPFGLHQRLNDGNQDVEFLDAEQVL
jgi:hypothetical protein